MNFKAPDKVYFQLLLVFAAGFIIWLGVYLNTKDIQDPNELLMKLGEAGGTIALITTVGALVQIILKNRDEKRQEKIQAQELARQDAQRDLEVARQDAQRELEITRERKNEKITFYKNVLDDLKTVYDKVERARLLIEAHRTAKTYGEQMRELIGGVVTLHNIKRALNPGFPKLEKKIRPCIDAMNLFIKKLLNEYRDNYKRISVLQGIDEAKKSSLKAKKAASDNSEVLPQEIPSQAWKEIKKLEKLSILRDDNRFEEYESHFLNYLDEASEILRRRIPIEDEEE